MSCTRRRSRTSRYWRAGVGAAAARLSPRGRLVRGLDTLVLAPVCRRRRRHGRLAVQRRCIRVRHDAFCISRHTERRLLEEGFRGRHAVLPGLYAGPVAPAAGTRRRSARRLRRAPRQGEAACRCSSAASQPHGATCPTSDSSCSATVRTARPRSPRPRGSMCADAVAFRGRRPQERGRARVRSRAPASRRASEREGYGLVVVEAAARGHAECRRRRARERGRRARRGRCQRRRRGAGRPPSPSGPRSSRRCAEGRLCAPRRSHGSSRMRTRLRIERSIELVTRAYAGGNR